MTPEGFSLARGSRSGCLPAYQRLPALLKVPVGRDPAPQAVNRMCKFPLRRLPSDPLLPALAWQVRPGWRIWQEGYYYQDEYNCNCPDDHQGLFQVNTFTDFFRSHIYQS